MDQVNSFHALSPAIVAYVRLPVQAVYLFSMHVQEKPSFTENHWICFPARTNLLLPLTDQDVCQAEKATLNSAHF
jgi:hypothetical protein